MATPNVKDILEQQSRGPRLERSIRLNFVGDWGMANFHRICSWLTQQFCDRAGGDSRVGIWNIRYGGIEAVLDVFRGEAQLAVATPAQMISTALIGQGIFAPYGPMPSLRALGVLPQNDRMILAIHPKYGIKSFEDLRQKRPALRIATSTNDGTNFIGFTAYAFMECHSITAEVLESWGGKYVTAHRPEQAIALVQAGEADALLQEAVMTPWWADIMENGKYDALAAEASALARFAEKYPNTAAQDPDPLPAGFWSTLIEPLHTLDFSDFVILVRDDLPEDVAHLLTWCLVETRSAIEGQYKHLKPDRSPLTYPLCPAKMARSPIPLHEGAKRYYQEAGHL
ncbi:uncharacterized protein Aud_009456 [Aspergillus udagawae]|uniref:Uncharacterized protein n=1 Tax=Aspergillus udagawae TaxID=91492 RepID=A0A8E0QZ11_9EURO|nr:uncharacterized protein Aud_009456 [Aspergillus udagawae]GIC92977.1 hypothetical protein Aud_009456 [Aspergillus udagawae]